MNDITITEKTIKANGLSHDTLQTFVTMAELEESTYNSQQELYEYELDTPYSEWAEAVESSSAITGGMISLMAQEGGSIMYTLKYDGLSVSINNDRDMISENKPVRLSQYLQENLSDTKYDSVEARNRAIESKVNEYQEMYRAWRDLIIAHSTVDSVTIEKPGYITGRGDYVGQTVSEEMKWTIIDYFSGSLPLSREYMNSLNGEEKDGIDDLRYCSIRIGNKDYISSITVGIAWKTEQTDKAEELTVPENESSIEDSFIDDLLHGFTARDQVINENPDVDTYPSSKYISTHEAYILAEYEYIEKYRDAQFTDEMVKDASWLYLDGLDRQYEAVSKYYLADRDLYDQKWADGYYERCRALFLLSEKYDLRVKITLKDALNDMISVGEQVEISVDG